MQEVQNSTVTYILENSDQTNDEQNKSTTDFQSYFADQSSNKDESKSEDNTLTAYYKSDEEKDIALASYTNTNTVIPVQETKKDETIVSEKNQILYESIIEDNYLSYDEIKDLNYEQIVEIKDFVMTKNEDGDYIQRSFMSHDKKAGMLLGTTSISQDSTFNKAIFNIAKNISDDKIFDTFMFDITGTQLSDQLMAYPEFQNIDYSKGASTYLTNKLASYQVKFDTAQDEDSKEFYQDMINAFQGLTNQYKSLKGESIHNDVNSNEKIEALVADLISVIKTGFTESELEYMQQLLAEIRKLLQEKNDEENPSSNEEIEKAIKAIEDALLSLEKKILGVVILNVDDDETEKNTSEINETTGLNFEERITVVEQKINDMKSGYYNQPTDFSNKNEEELKEEAERLEKEIK